MGLVILFLALNLVLIGTFIEHHRHRARLENPPPLPKRLLDAELRAFGIRQLALVAVLAWGYDAGLWTAPSVGFHGREHWAHSVLAGEAAFFVLVVVYTLLLHVAGAFAFMRLTAVRGNLRVWPRGRVQKWVAGVFIMVFNPFTEELVMRGILIHHWGLMLGSAVVPVVVGLLLNSGLHWYQGWRMQLWHAMFFVVAVSLLYSPFGLTAAITAHVFGDVMPLLGLRRQLRKVRATRRTVARA